MKFITKVFALIKKILDDQISKVAAVLSYFSLLSFFPFMIFLLTLVSYSEISVDSLVQELGKFLPESAYELVKSVIIDTFQSSNQNLLSFGILFALYAGSGGIRAIMDGLNTAYNVKENRNFIFIFFISIVYTVALAVIIIFSFTLIIFGEVIGNTVINWFNGNRSFKYFWDFYRVGFTLFLIFIVFVGMYCTFPARKLKIKKVIPGALFTTLGWFVSSLGFSYYVNNFANYSRVYGSLGAVIILMTWIYITSMMILIGGELNAFLNEKSLMDNG
ncbi:YihY/virulence factor BrkB family protein [Oceanirhabdus sp. W0125-5]|uniref:YihY/virulence factor BrkB family protein n=1 Tax=Oceanirhabdus sp. W0125-5 TaxID=2999116 RepID=UPI0022F2F12C|nr:YihY/virulence factor BrkB family protein [Oceanirhabdus sp. W0125-5]WBW99269.1 YihY/virulence factor BrkB family protein [Oceanirhabdus sp. W0125-5]